MFFIDSKIEEVYSMQALVLDFPEDFPEGVYKIRNTCLAEKGFCYGRGYRELCKNLPSANFENV